MSRDAGIEHGALDAHVLDEAAAWLLQLHSGEATAADHQALQQWRVQHADHERAWQRAQHFLQGVHDIPPAVGRQVLQRRSKFPRRRVLRQLLGAAMCAPPAWLVSRHAPHWSADYRTATGEQQQIILSDGTRLTLNTASAVDVRFDQVRRLLHLRAGEVLIATAKDTAPHHRPLSVITNEGRVRALGTRFSVRQLQGRSHVAVYADSIEVYPDDRADPVLRLNAGQQTFFTAHDVAEASEVDPVIELWSQSMLVATDMQLADLLTELDRYRPGKLRCDPAVAALRISGAFPLTDIPRSLALIRDALPVRITEGYWARVEAR